MPPPVQTHKDDRLLAWLADYSAGHPYAPTVREAAAAMGVTVSTVFARLERLRDEGRVDWVEGQSRTLHVVDPDDGAVS